MEDYKKKYEDTLERTKQGEKSDYNPYKATVESITAMVEKYANGDLKDFYDNIKVKCKDAMEYNKTWVEKQGKQKPTDKNQPKFKVDDFILNGDVTSKGEYEIFKILKVCSSWYDVENIYDGRQTMITFAQEDTCRLWTIQDAKDGDILTWDDSECITIFKSIFNEDSLSFVSHGCIGHYTGTFEPRQFYQDMEGVHPATKEQRDQIFSKMKEAGFGWDSERRELKIVDWSKFITHNPNTPSTIEEETAEIKPHLPNGYIHYDKGFEEAQEYLIKRGFDIVWNDCDVYIDEKHITQTVANVLTWADEHPVKFVKWSKEDENILEDAITAVDLNLTSEFQESNPNLYKSFEAAKRWLKSLKER